MAEPAADLSFAAVLRAAIRASGLSLSRVVQLLRQRGLSMSTAGLSHWQSGASVPTRATSLPVLQALETILDLTEGELVARTSLSRPEAPDTQRSQLRVEDEVLQWVRQLRVRWGLNPLDGFATEMTLSRVVISGRERRDYRFEQTLRGKADGVQRKVLVLRRQAFSTGLPVPELVALRGCTIGRQEVTDIGGELRAVELVLPARLRVGQTWHVVTASATGEICPSNRHLAHADPTIDLTAAQVVFADELPARVWRLTGQVQDGQMVLDEEGEPEVAPGSMLYTALTSQEPGRVAGFRWEW